MWRLLSALALAFGLALALVLALACFSFLFLSSRRQCGRTLYLPLELRRKKWRSVVSPRKRKFDPGVKTSSQQVREKEHKQPGYLLRKKKIRKPAP